MPLLKVRHNVPHSEGGVARQALHHIDQKMLLQNVRLCQISFGERLPTSLGIERPKLLIQVIPCANLRLSGYQLHNYYSFHSNLALCCADYVSFHHGLRLVRVDGASAENGVRALVVGVEAVLGHPVLGTIAAGEHLEARLVGSHLYTLARVTVYCCRFVFDQGLRQ